jgi:hypothetical protein
MAKASAARAAQVVAIAGVSVAARAASSVYGENATVSQDLWAQFLNLQGPAMQSMMGAYMEQSKKMYAQMQEQLDSQTRNIFSGFQFPNFVAGFTPEKNPQADADEPQGTPKK